MKPGGSGLSRDSPHGKAAQKQRDGMLYPVSQPGIIKTLHCFSRMARSVKGPG